MNFKEIYPGALNPWLQRIYWVGVSENFSSETSISQRSEVEKFFLIDKNENLFPIPEIPFELPNDYNDPVTGERNTLLDLIKAPLAWNITTGDPSILIGFSDAAASLDHPDLDGQIFDTITEGSYSGDHGVASTGAAVAKANNNSHIVGVAYDSKVVFAYCGSGASTLIPGLWRLANEFPDIRVINCSWSLPESHSRYDELVAVIADINALPNPPLVVAAADNGGTVYQYPASFDTTIGVTTVGHRFPIDFAHNFDWGHPNGDVWQLRSWKDVHLLRPHIPGNTTSHTHNDKVDVSSPAHLMISITNDYEDWPDGYRIAHTTSATTPIVSGIVALVFSANPSLTAPEVRDIIRNTADDIYYIPYNQPYIGQLGTGRVNAYRAVLTAHCMANPSSTIDLAMQNSKLDYFDEPDPNTAQPWNSEDIFVRNQNDGQLIQVHQNPEYDSSNPNYAYVQVTNNSCITSSGNDEVTLYWAKANTALSWPDHWDGSLFVTDPVTGQVVLMGEEIGTMTIPPLEIGESTLIEFEWNVPNPEDYVNINSNPWHFCLLARIISPDDPMTFPEGDFITDNVKNNNNIAWKNMTVVDIIPGVTTPVDVAVAVGNPTDQTESYTLEFYKEVYEAGKAIYEEAEVSITLGHL